MMIGIAMLYEIAPVMAKACSTPTDAADDWMTPVNTAPTSTPRNGLLNVVSSPVNSGISASGDTAPLMSCIPYMSTAKPAMMIPTSLCFSFLLPIIIITPISAMTGEKFSGFNIEMNRLSLSIPERLRIHAVRVVPMLEPMMTPTVWASSMMPEFTSPTSITVSADEDWIAIVTIAPKNKLLIGFEVTSLSIFWRLPPASFSRLPDITCIPKRKKASPPHNCNIE